MDSATLTKDKAIYQRVMNVSLIVLALGFVMLGVGKVALSENRVGWFIVKFIVIVLEISACYFWCLFDSLLNGHSFGKRMLPVYIFILPLALFIYFYRSRGFKNGSLMLVKALVLFFFLLLFAAVSGVITGRILGIPIR